MQPPPINTQIVRSCSSVVRHGTVQPTSSSAEQYRDTCGSVLSCHVDDERERGRSYAGHKDTVVKKLTSMVGRPSTEALAMAGADWARQPYGDEGEEEEEDAPPAHLRAFEAFLETVVPADMALAFGSEEAARARRGEGRRRRSHREDVEEKLKLWAKAVAREARRGALGGSRQQPTTTTSPRRVAHAGEAVPVLARPPGELTSSIAARRGSSKDKGAPALPGQGRVVAGKLAAHPTALLVPSPRSGRRVEEASQSKPLPKQDIKCT